MLRLCGYFFFNDAETNRKCQLYFFPPFSPHKRVQKFRWAGKCSRKSQICHRAVQQLPFQLCPTAAESIIPQGSVGMSHPRLSAAAGSLASSMAFVSHQILLILGVSISSHPHNISQKNHYVSELFSHTRISLNHLYLKGKEKKYKSGSL